MVVKVCVLTGYGMSSNLELATAFEMLGAKASQVHIYDLIENPAMLDNFQILAISGGFSFGDHLGAGLVYSQFFNEKMKAQLDKFVADGKLVIGIGNGFQVLVKMGMLPNSKGDWTPEVSLVHNDSGLYQDFWVNVKYNESADCVWTKGLDEADLPIRHGEGKFVFASAQARDYVMKNNLVALSYAKNPNGSEDDIAGICDSTGRVLGLMPHVDSFIYPFNHPKWHRTKSEKIDGLDLLRNGVEFFD